MPFVGAGTVNSPESHRISIGLGSDRILGDVYFILYVRNVGASLPEEGQAGGETGNPIGLAASLFLAARSARTA